MAEPFLGEIRIFSFGFAPKGWARCDGQILPIDQNQALFSIMGNLYGGDGDTTFALPDLEGRVPLHHAPELNQGAPGGEYVHQLTIAEMPNHTHALLAVVPEDTDSNVNSPAGNFLSNSAPGEIYSPGGGGAILIPLSTDSIAPDGGDWPHENQQPYLTLNFCVALQGIPPSRS